MALSLVLGPAHAGKVALLLDRYLEALERDPWLVVPNRHDVERIERDLLRRRSALLAGRIGTFDDLFEHVAGTALERKRIASEIQRVFAARRAIASAKLESLARSASSAGFTDALLSTLAELGSALVDSSRLAGDLGVLARAYETELDRLELWDREGVRRAAVSRIASDLAAWDDAPVFVYGFEDWTGAEWALVEAIAARSEITVSIPYEPGRPAFSALERTVASLAALSGDDLLELPPSTASGRPQALRHLERELFADTASASAPLDGSLRFLEGAGARGTVELLGAELVALIRAGTEPEQIAIVCDSSERWRAPLDAVLGPLGVPYALEARLRLGETSIGRALLALLRFGLLGGTRSEFFAFLRSPYSGLERRSVDFVEGRLRGRAIVDPARVEEETERLRGAPVPTLVELRRATEPLAGVRAVLETMVRNAWGLDSPPTGADAREDARAYRAALATLDELAALRDRISADDALAALERTRVRLVGSGERGRVAVLDYARARTRQYDVVFLLGLEEGSLPRRDRPSPLLEDDLRERLGAGLVRTDPVARDRYLFYTACTRARERLVLVRQASTEDGVPREPSSFWQEVTSRFDPADVARATRRRALSSLTWPLDSAPSERERLRALARLAAEDRDGAASLASANGWTRRLDRALMAFERPTRLSTQAALASLSGRSVFSATELERFADCSSAWLVERVIDPKTIDAEPDAMLRGQVLHTTLHRFYAALPRELGAERVTPENVEGAVALVRRCLEEAFESGVRLDLTPLQAAELRETLLSDLEGFVRDEAAWEVPFVPRRLEVSFGSERAAPELQRGLQLGDDTWLSGKIDRVDVDPFGARGIVQDYKSGKSAHSARAIERELRLQIPLYVLALRDLVGLEPLGGVYRALSGKRYTRGMLRASARDELPGFARDDYLDEDDFWGQVEAARDVAAANADRIRAGDVRHDPRGGECPSWCDLWPMCRVARA